MTPSRSRLSALVAAAVIMVTVHAGLLAAQGAAGQAPAFAAVDSRGTTHRLADYAGKIVVLEWHNPGCAYVKKHYGGAMQAMQREWTARGVVWLTVLSSGAGQQGYMTPEEANGYLKDRRASPTAMLLDAQGALATLYGVKTTPQAFVIGPDGAIAYVGAIDSKPTIDAADIAAATNYLAAALSDVTAGRPVTTPATRPYGCSLRLASGASH